MIADESAIVVLKSIDRPLPMLDHRRSLKIERKIKLQENNAVKANLARDMMAISSQIFLAQSILWRDTIDVLKR